MYPERSSDARGVALITRASTSRGREYPPERDASLIGETYLFNVTTAPDIRRRLWAGFVRRATDHAKQSRGWSIPRVATEAKVGAATIYRWLDGDWETAPKAEVVERFCDALDIPTQAAFSILWPGKAGAATVTEPLPANADAEAVQRKLNDPNTPESEKAFLRETLRMLAIRR